MKTANKREIIVDIIEETESTNTYLKQNCATLPEWYTLRAHRQTAGRGRFSRVWISRPGEDLTFSTLVPVSERLQEYLLNIPQISALAVRKSLKNEGLDVKIKWPNDILVENRKIAGILVEGVFQKGVQYIVVGIGLNVNSRSVDGVDIPVTSTWNELRRKLDPDKLMMDIVNNLQVMLEQLSKEGFAPFRRDAELLLAFRGEKRTMTVNGEKLTGTIMGVAENGGLLVSTENGEVQTLISGEISFRC